MVGKVALLVRYWWLALAFRLSTPIVGVGLGLLGERIVGLRAAVCLLLVVLGLWYALFFLSYGWLLRMDLVVLLGGRSQYSRGWLAYILVFAVSGYLASRAVDSARENPESAHPFELQALSRVQRVMVEIPFAFGLFGAISSLLVALVLAV